MPLRVTHEYLQRADAWISDAVRGFKELHPTVTAAELNILVIGLAQDYRSMYFNPPDERTWKDKLLGKRRT